MKTRLPYIIALLGMILGVSISILFGVNESIFKDKISKDLENNPKIMKIADKQFTIPQMGTTDSLNVSVAAGMMLYEVMRQRIAIK